MENKVAFIVPYFGRLPVYFPHFVNSIRDKPFQLFFFTDIKKPEGIPSNITWINLSFNDIKQLFNDKLQQQAAIVKPYKFCDLKPTYGLVFEDYIKDYTFWGSIDIDTIVGNFDNFINDDRLKAIDVYSAIKEYVSGAFFLIRNNKDFNSLFKKSKDWVKVLADPEYCAFDECGGHFFDRLKAGESIFDLNTPVQSFTEVVFSESLKGLRVLFENTILEPKGPEPAIVANNGVVYKSQQFLLLHYIYLKAKFYFYINPHITRQPYFVSGLGMFKTRPNKWNVLFSVNFLNAVIKKVQINLRKLKFKER